jgi:hypothetical protein
MPTKSFSQRVIAAIHSPTYKDAPAAYVQFTVERALWERLGWTYKDIYTRPRKQVNDYIDIIRLELSEEAATLERQQRKNAAASRGH